MINLKLSRILGTILIFIVLLAFNQTSSQAQPQENPPDSAPGQIAPPVLPEAPQGEAQGQQQVKSNKKKFHFFWVNEQKIEQKEKHKKELEDLVKKQKQETEELKKKIEVEKVQEKKTIEKQIETMTAVQKIIDERTKEVEEIKKSDNIVEVITNEEDPLYIKKAQVLKGTTNFMRIKDVEFNYKLELHNQTPKVINFAFIVWERRIAFNDTQTLAKELKIAKPIIPYEKRIVEYNELNSRRDGETYKVQIAKVVFEDGTQWKNPAVKDIDLVKK